MTWNSSYKRFLFLVVSIYVFIQCTIFMTDTANVLFSLAAPKINGEPMLFSPYNMISYCNIVLHGGIIISSILFIISIEPIIRYRLKKRFISIPLAIISTPFYFILLYIVFQGTILLVHK